MINVHDHDHLHHHKYHHYQPSLLEAAHLKANLTRPTLLHQPPIKYEDDRDCGDLMIEIMMMVMMIVMIS